MITAEAINALSKAEAITAANSKAIPSIAFAVAALPEDFKVHDLEKYLQQRRRARGDMTTTVLDDFAAYTLVHQEDGACVMVSPDSMSARAVLNLGTPNEPGHADNTATLHLKRTAAYEALRAIANGSAHKQATIAEFLEDWADHTQCFNSGTPITPGQAVAAVRKITIENLKKLESTEQQLSASRSMLETVQATSGTDPLPTHIYFKCEPFQGLQERTFVMRMAIHTGNDKPALALRVVKQEEHDEEMAEELATLVRASLPAETMPVYLGSYQVKG